MTQDTSNSSSEAVGIVAAAAVLITGAFLGLSSLLGARWWVHLIILLVAASATLAMFDSDPDAGIFVLGLLVLFSLYGFVSTLGWIATVAIVLVTTVVVVLLLSDKPVSEPPAPGPPPVRATAPASSSPPPPPTTVPDEVLERHAREFLADGGARETRAVIAALRSHVRDEGLKLGPEQHLSWIASRVLASTRSAAPTGPRRTPAAPARPAAPRQQTVPPAPAKTRTSTRQHLHEFGSFEIERAISRVLDDSPGLTDTQLVDRVLEALGTADRSPFAMQRLSDAIGRVQGIAPSTAEERQVQQRERRIARVPKRDPGGRTKLYEYGSHEIERVVEQLFTADRQWRAKDLHEAVLDVLGIEDRSNLGRERVADAAAKVSGSPARSSRTGGRQHQSAPRKQAAKKTQKPSAKKATKKQQKPKPPAKKAAGARKTKATEDATRKKSAPTPERTRETGRTTPPPTPAKKPSKPEGGEGTPDVKDIAKLLGF